MLWSRYKYDLIHVGITLIIFFTAFFIKFDNLKAPLVRHQEWITAHTLITAEIWEENGGPSYSGYSPVYTYPEKSNFGRKMLGGITNSKGHHYVSYPPFSFIFGYYGMQLLGGQSVNSIRTLSLVIGLASSILLMFIIRNYQSNRERVSVPGIIGVSFFTFGAGNMLYFGHLYFADVLIAFFALWLLYLYQKLVNHEYTSSKLIIATLFLVGFLAVYTEWLGLFLIFLIGLIAFINFFRTKVKIQLWIFVFAALGAVLSLITTVWQYSSIKTGQVLKEAWVDKYAVRSGNGLIDNPQNQEFSMRDGESFGILYSHLKGDMIGFLDFSWILLGLFVVLIIFKPFRKNIYQLRKRIHVPLLFLGAVLMHYLIFFNFNAVHTFSSIKFSIALALFIAFLITIIWEAFSFPFKQVLQGVIIIIAGVFCYQEIRNYSKNINANTLDKNLYQSRLTIAKELDPRTYIFTDLPNCPEQIYIIKQDVFPANDSSEVIRLMDAFLIDHAFFYTSSENRIDQRFEFSRKGGKIITEVQTYNNVNFP